MAVYTQDTALVHVPKCAGWSIKLWMHRALPGHLVVPKSAEYRDEKWEGVKIDSNMTNGHLRLAEWEERVVRSPAHLDKILLPVRNPYRHALSQWAYWREMWRRRLRMAQHRVAAQHPSFTDWLRNPRAQYHVRYEYHDHRPPKYLGDDAPGYADYGGYYLYWAGLPGEPREQNELPENVEIVRVEDLQSELEAAFPELDDPPEVTRENARDAYIDPAEHYTEEALRIVEEMYAFAFDNWYERGL